MDRDTLIARLERLQSGEVDLSPEEIAIIVEGLRLDEDDEVQEAASHAAAVNWLDAEPAPLATAVLAILTDATAPPGVRAGAAITLGPLVELCSTEGYDDDGFGDPPVEQAIYTQVMTALKSIYQDADSDPLVRRCCLEGAVRAIEVDWVEPAIREAWATDDVEWKTTALFCMGYVEGFETELLGAIGSDDEQLACAAIDASAEAMLDLANGPVMALARTEETPLDVRLTAILALGTLMSEGAFELLDELQDHEDEEIAEAAAEAMDELIANQAMDEDLEGEPFDA